MYPPSRIILGACATLCVSIHGDGTEFPGRLSGVTDHALAAASFPRAHRQAPRQQGTLQTQHVRLVPVQAYGWRDTSEAARPLGSVEAKVGGGLLARVVGVAEAADGRLFVLDGDFRKIVEFDRVGQYVRVILGGHGEGPGEFADPFGISLDKGEVLRVLDQGLTRVTSFDTTGALLGTVRLHTRHPMAIASAGNNMFVLSAIRANTHLVTQVSESGTVLRSFIPVGNQLQALRLFGYDGAIAAADSQTILYCPPVPGRWFVIRGGEVTRHGAELFPDVHGVLLDNQPGPPMHVLPIGTQAIGQLRDGRTIIVYREWNLAVLRERKVGVPKGSWVLAVFDPAGRYVGSHRLDPYGDVSFHFTVSHLGPYLYAVVNDPYPRVIKFRIETIPERP